MKNMAKMFWALISFVCLVFPCKSVEQYKFRLIDVPDGLSDNQIRGLSMVPDGRVGIRTASILNIYDGASFEYFPYDKDRKYVWTYSRPPKEYYDGKDRVWMKELRYLLLLDLKTNAFNYDIQGELETMGIDKRLKNLFIDDAKNYWFQTEDNTFSFYDVGKHKKQVIDRGDSEFTQRYGVPLELAQYKNFCWIVYSSGLIRCWDYTSSDFLFQDSRFEGIINEYTDRLYLHPDSVGNLWLMYNNGICFYNRILREWRDVTSISGISNFFTCMDMDRNGDIWAGTSRSGLRHIDGKTFAVSEMPDMPLTNGGMLHNDIYTVMSDPRGGLWVGTLFQGLCYYHPSMQKFQLAQTSPGSSYITNESVRCFLEDEDGTVLVGSGKGLFRFHPETHKVEQMVYEEAANQPILTGLSIFNTPVKVGKEYEGHVILSVPMNRTDKIELRYDENFISIEFSGLNYANPDHTYYKYRLKNYEEGWVESPAAALGRAVYTGLRPGEYEFEVYAANGDKVWSKEPARLAIVVHPPFWATYYALAVYVLMAAGMVYWISKMYVRWEKEKMMAERRENARRQQEHLEEMKLRFFTNISHEFRTPLTLILTPLGSLIKQQSDVDLKQRLVVIYRNAEKLLQLVNQLLDFRKLEMQGERLSVRMGDIVVFVQDAVEAFCELVKEKGVTLAFESKIGHLYMNYDHDKVYKVVNNLLSNAVKFTPSGGRIAVRVENLVRNGREYVAVSVRDTGCGMEEKDKERIFTRFYQVESSHKSQSGSGIGLHLVKGYVDLHGGEITVDSRPGEGSVFTFFLPTDLQHDEKVTIAHGEDKETVSVSVPSAAEDGSEPSGERKKLLIVEDNADFRAYLVHEFSSDFDVVEAGDGVEGEEMVREEWPDLVISDLMMPKRDGIAFCQRMKNDIHTSHIPFILLTAKMSDDARIESYKAGADSYISKPFNFEMLQVRVQKLIEQRETRTVTFKKNIEITPSEITTTSLDEEFVKKAVAFVEKNMDNSEYSLEDLSSDLGLSKTHLNRKLTVILNMKPLQFIRSIRLKRAAQLLVGSQYNVVEIADKVGFNTIKYFNRYFKEEFGMTPTQYREANKKVNKSPKT